MNLLQQFKNYLENQINNPMFTSGEEEREITFTSYEEIKEESIYLVAISNGKEYKFYYDCYQDFGTTQHYQFELA